MSFSNPTLRIGFQILGYNDHIKNDYNVRAVADVTKSGALGLDRYVIILATNPNIHQKKIAYLIVELLKSQASYVRFIEPHQLAPLASKDNWVRMRARGLSTFLGPMDTVDAIPEPISSDNDGVSSILTCGSVSIADQGVRRVYDEATLRLKAKDFPGTQLLLLKARHLGPTVPEVLNALAVVALIKHEWWTAIQYCREALELRPEMCSALQNMSVAMRKMGCFSDSLVYARRAYELYPSDLSCIVGYSKALRLNGQLEAARDLLTPLTKDVSLSQENILLELGADLLGLNDFDGALRCYLQHSKLFPLSALGFWGAGLALARNEKPAEAIVHLERAAKLDPKNPDILFELGDAQRDSHQLDKALISFRSAEKLMPHAVGIRGNLANILRDSGKLLEALERYDSIVKQMPTDPIIWNARGECLIRLGRYEEALASFEAGIRLGFKTSSLLNNAGLCCLKLKQADMAKAYFEEAIEVGDRDGCAHANMGSLLTIKGELGAAKPYLEMAIKKGRRSHDNLVLLAQCMVETKEYDEANTLLDQALTANPKYAGAHAIRGKIHEARGDLDLAIKSLENALKFEPSMDYALEALNRVRKARRDKASQDKLDQPPGRS